MKYVAYTRVSTAKQGLGLDAQMSIIERFIGGDDEIVATFSEKESGKKDDRPELAKALDYCEKSGATLITAKLDRLTRDAEFGFALRKKNIAFRCCDIPTMDTLTFGMLLVVAQKERELISERTKAALAVLKAKGVKLGNPNGFAPEVRQKGDEAKKRLATKRNAPNVLMATTLFESLGSYTAVASRMNDMGLTTPQGKPFRAETIKRLVIRGLNQGIAEPSAKQSA